MKPIDKYLVIENKLAKTDRDERMNELNHFDCKSHSYAFNVICY